MLKKAFFTLTLAAALTTSAFAKDVTIPTARGEVTFTQTPHKVAVFDAATIDILQHLGIKVAGAPDVAKTLPYLKPAVAQATNIGTVFEPNLETLNSLKPDLIIVATRSAKKLDDVKTVANAIDLTPNPKLNTIEAGLANLDSLGKLFAKQDKANEYKTEIETLLKETQAAVKGKGNGLIIIVNGGKMSAFGDKGRLGWVHSALGIPLAKADVHKKGTNHGEPISHEFLQKINPDWLFVLDRTAAIGEEGKTAQEILDNELVHQTKAWKNGQIVYLSSAAYLAAGGIEQMRTDLINIKKAFSK
ncbi:siderophore ABC transporter substrate-binding protein [Actinobacillus capsulatus]|uniref:siderophore ABC transporter substrate-binding protein n=1 Tax=Actinobacillus capsulatus TaxID=717 RepID=UPI00037921CD|nr:siderophore ABC transporter substrate-binding protein [Actinobacillus capsulatus]